MLKCKWMSHYKNQYLRKKLIDPREVFDVAKFKYFENLPYDVNYDESHSSSFSCYVRRLDNCSKR